ncbi:MAG: hypothetical protein MK080_11775 [Opitutales bacterium]|nr:hypothetical protein [Opitutales bacterium]
MTEVDRLVEYRVQFESEGVYELELSVDDGVSVSVDNITFDVSGAGNATPVPTIMAADQRISVLSPLTLEVDILDDDVLGQLQFGWRVVSGPSASLSVSTLSTGKEYLLSFPEVGEYTVEFTVSDGNSAGSDQIDVTVLEMGQFRSIWSWGENRFGSAGPFETFSSADMSRPYKVASGFAKVEPRERLTIALDRAGRVLASGNNSTGGLGRPNFSNRGFFAEIPGLPKIVDIANHSLFSRLGGVAVDENGRVWSWGSQSLGQDGLGGDPIDSELDTGSLAQQVPGLENVVRVFAGGSRVFAATHDGALYGWGNSAAGALGLADDGSEFSQRTPAPVPGVTDVRSVAVGLFFSVVCLEDGSVLASGSDFLEVLGNGTGSNTRQFAPVFIQEGPDLPLTGIQKVVAGAYHTLALTTDGRVYSWGYNGVGQLGLGDTATRTVAHLVTDPSDPSGYLADIIDIAAGSDTSFALKVDGRVLGWGTGRDHAFGSATDTGTRTEPGPVAGLPGGIRNIWASAETFYAATDWSTWGQFQAEHFTPAEIAAGDADPDLDYLGGGRKNFMAYVLRQDPKIRSRDNPLVAWMDGDRLMVEMEYLASAVDFEVTIETSTNLIDWVPASPSNQSYEVMGDMMKALYEFETNDSPLFVRSRFKHTPIE